jgi:putative molybdopterin biosynthesis protein
MGKHESEIENHLAEHRQKRGIPASQLAAQVGVSRQTIYAIEAGEYTPNTAVALRLARVLEVRIEDLFVLPGAEPPAAHTEAVTFLEGEEPPQPGQPVQLCPVDRRLIATSPSPVRWYFPDCDAVVASAPAAGGKGRVQVLQAGQDLTHRILVAGCDPAISVLARHVQTAGIELVLVHRNSSQALALLREGLVHVAGTHLRDEASGESNLPEIGRVFARNAVAVVTFSAWEEGIVTAAGNPKGIRGIEDMARPDVAIVNRERGAGSRSLLDHRLRELGIEPAQVRGYGTEIAGHLPATWQVQTGAADCCIATRGAARVFGLGFLPLVTERYDLVVRRQHLEMPAIQTLLDTLGRSRFRRELESLGGYDTTAAGQRML